MILLARSLAVLLALPLLSTSAGGGGPTLETLVVHSGGAPAVWNARAPTLWIPPFGSLEVTGPYRPPPHRYGSGHRGIDLAAAVGMTVVAPTSGTVTFSGTVVDRPVVSVRAGDGIVYSLEPVRSGFVAGERVAAGALLGEVSGGGHCQQECVHLGVRVGGEYVNPLRYFRSRPELLPW